MKATQFFKFKFTILHSAAGLLVVTLMSGCSFKSVPKNQHDGTKNSTSIEETASGEMKPEIKVAESDLTTLDLTPIYNDLLRITKTSKDDKDKIPKEEKIKVSNQIVEKLKPFILSEVFIENLKYQRDTKIQTAFRYFNESLAMLIDEGASVDATVDLYVKTLEKGCNDKFQGCVNLGFFGRDPKTPRIVLQLVKRLDEKIDKETDKLTILREYYRHILIVNEIKNRQPDADLNLMLLKHARDYAKALKENNDKATAEEFSLVSRLGKVFELTINQLSGNETDPKVRDMIRSFKPWSYSSLDYDYFPYGNKKLFSLASKWHLYESDNSLNKDLKSVIDESQKSADKSGDSFTQSVQKIENDDKIMVRLLKMKDLKDLPTDNEFFFLVDRYYRGHLNLEEIQEVWSVIHEKKGLPAMKSMLSTIEGYIRWEFLRMKSKTNSYVRGIIQMGEFDNETMVKKVLQNSRDLDSQWAQFLSRTEGLKTFLKGSLKSQYPNDESVVLTENLITTLPKNTKYFVAYPNMMLLAYFLRKTEATLSIETYFGEVKIPAGIVVNAFLDARLDSWFNFAGDTFGLNQTEILISFDFALRTGVFQTFSAIGNKFNISEVDFLREISKQYLTEQKTTMDDAEDKFRIFEPSSDGIVSDAKYSEFKSVCEGKNNSEIDFKDMLTFLTPGNGKNGLTLSMAPVYGGVTGDLKSSLNSLSSEYLRKRLIIEVMGSVTAEYLRNASVDESKKAEIEQSISAAEKEVSDFRDRLKRLYLKLLALHRTTKECYSKLLKLEKQMVYEQIRGEEIFFGNVWDTLTALQTADATTKESLKADLLKKSLSNNEDKIEDNKSYRYTKLGLMYRTIERLKTSSLSVNVNNIATENERRKSYGDSTRLDLIEKNGPVKKEVFVRNAMNRLNGRPGSFASWIGNLAESSNVLKSKMELSLELFRTGLIILGKDETGYTAKEVLEDTLSDLQMFHIDENEAVILKQLGLDSIFPSTALEGLLFKGSDAMGALDYPFEKLKYTSLSGKESTSILDSAMEFYKTNSGLGFFIFAPNNQTKDVLRASYDPLVRLYERYFNDFSKVISACEENPNCKNIEIRYDLRPDRKIYRSALDAKGQLRLLSEANVWYFTSRMKRFHEDTQNCFNTSNAQANSLKCPWDISLPDTAPAAAKVLKQERISGK